MCKQKVSWSLDDYIKNICVFHTTANVLRINIDKYYMTQKIFLSVSSQEDSELWHREDDNRG